MDSPLAILDQPKAAPQMGAAPADDDENGTPVATLVQWFEDAEDASQDARKAAERDRDYYDGIQLTAEQLKTLRARGQPDVIINRIQPKINFLLGYEASNRSDPRAFPRTPQDEDASEAATDALRYVKDAASLETTFSKAWEYLLIEGFGGIEMTVEPAQDGTNDIKPVMWDWDRLFYDPFSRRDDFSDARYLGGVIWMDVEDAKQQWPDSEEAIEWTLHERTASATYDDRPNWQKWTTGQGKRKRVRIVQMYHREAGQWMHCIFTKGGILERMEVPFRDQDGKSWCPLILQSAFVDRKNNRYGLVRQMVSVQDEINKRRSKALHRLSVNQIVAERGAVDDVDMARKEMAKPDGFVEINPGFKFDKVSQAEQVVAELQLLQESKNEIELLGPNAALLGKGPDAASGRAILANKQSGQTEISMLMDRHRHLKKRTYQAIWSLIRQYKNEEWWIRVTDDEKNVKFVGFNRKVTVAEELTTRLTEKGMPPDQVAQTLQQMAQDPMRGQMLDQVARIENNPTQMYMDITIEEVPDVANVAEEQFQALVQLAPAVTFPPSVYLEASSLRNKKKLLEIIEKPNEPDPNALAMQAEAAKLELEKLGAEVMKTKADAHKTMIEADMLQMPQGVVAVPQVVEPGGPPQGAPPVPTAQPNPPQPAGFSLSEGVPPPGPGDQQMQPPPGLSGDMGPMP